MTTPPVFLADTRVLQSGERLDLVGPEGQHAAKVRRLRPGERVDVVDGSGLRVRCLVRGAGPDGLDLTVVDRSTDPPPEMRVCVVQALVKGDRSELAVELLTEVGVDEIVPWSASRAVVQWQGSRGERSWERWRSTARESAKQARRAWFPVVQPLASTGSVAERLAGADVAVVLHEDAEEPLVAMSVPRAGNVVLVVGPEGGITDDELETFRSAGARPGHLGSNVLRASTAGAVATAVLLARSQW